MELNELKSKLDNYCKLLTEHHRAKYPCSDEYYTYTMGKKYIRVINTTKAGYRYSFCFVDFEGNLYKCAGWNKPAQGIRGHIDNPILDLGGFYKR